MTEGILVTGPDRSGTTLLYALLASHPEICMVRRTNLWRWFDGSFGDLSVPANLTRCLEAMARYGRLRALEIDYELLREEFGTGAATYGRLFGLVYAQHAARTGKPRWGDKSLHTEHCADRVFAEVPDARMIQLVRDPRDRYASVVRRHGGQRKHLGTVTAQWLASARRASRNLERYPGRYLALRYETLATEPERATREVCAFLQVPFTRAMLTLDGVADGSDPSGNSSFEPFEPGTISTRSIGRYANVLLPAEIAFVQASTRRWMAAWGYEPAPVRLGARERAAFLGRDLPRERARMAARQAAGLVAGGSGRGVPPRRLGAPVESGGRP